MQQGNARNPASFFMTFQRNIFHDFSNIRHDFSRNVCHDFLSKGNIPFFIWNKRNAVFSKTYFLFFKTGRSVFNQIYKTRCFRFRSIRNTKQPPPFLDLGDAKRRTNSKWRCTPDMGNYYRVKIPNGLGSRNR